MTGILLPLIITNLILVFFILYRLKTKSQNLLIRSEKQFHDIFESSAIGMALLSLNGNFYKVNDSLCKILGYPGEELLKINMKDLTYPDDLKQNLELNQQLLNREFKFFHLKKRCLHKSGFIIWVKLSVSLIYDAKNKPLRFLAQVEDITQKQKHQQELLESKERFQTLVNNIPGAVYRCLNDKNWTMNFISNNIKEISGYPASDFINNAKRPYASIIHPDDQMMVNDSVQNGVQTNTPYIIEYRIITATGSIRWVYEKGQGVFSPEGQLLWLDGAIFDITGRKNLSENIKKERSQLLSIFDGINELVYVADPETYDLLYINAAFQRTFGESVGKKCYQVLHGLDAPCPFCTNKYIFESKNNEPFVWEKQNSITKKLYRCIDNAIFWEGKRWVRYEMAIDITDKKQIEEQLIKEKNYSELILHLIPSAVFVVDKNNIVTEWNKKAEEITGYSKKEVIGKKCTIFADFPCTERCGVFSPQIKKPVSSVECSIKTKNGKLLTISKNADIIKNEKGEIIAGIESFEDITEKNFAINQIRKLTTAINQSPTAIVITDLDGNIEYINPLFTELTGYTFSDVSGKTPRILKSGKQAPKDYDRLWKTISTGGVWQGEFHNKKKNGDFYWEYASISPIRDANEKITNYIKIGEDYTERKLAQEQLKKSIEIKSQFTSMVSHELRTPLTAIKEGIGIVLDETAGSINEDQKDFLDTAKRNVDRLTRLINDVLDFQKLESGHMSFDLKSGNINETITDVHITMLPLANEKNLDFVLDLNNDLPTITYDTDKITQVLTNLVSNAIKFTNQGGITISSFQRDNTLQISVKDTGPGFSDKDKNKLFKEFEQLENPNERKTGGTGLGLAICKQIIEQHHGKIWAEAEQGKGATFHFVLPVEERRHYQK